MNVSCRGGSRVEIKGVSHTKWIPGLTHNECFRQWALLHIRERLHKEVKNPDQWKIHAEVLNPHFYRFRYKPLKMAQEQNYQILAINLPGFKGMLSHFTQPGKIFADEISDRLKVIACIEKPHLCHTEEFISNVSDSIWDKLRKLLKAKDNDAQLILWGPEADIKTAIETVEERCMMAFEGVPNETRKSFENGTTIFERVLPGADRMYPDTDSPPIPLEDEHIEKIGERLPSEVYTRYLQLKEWTIPEDTYTYIFSRNLYPQIERIINTLKFPPRLVGTFFGHHLKFVEGHYKKSKEFSYDQLFNLFEYIKENRLDIMIAGNMLPVIFEHPKMDFESVLTSIHFKRMGREEILVKIDFLIEKFKKIRHKKKEGIIGHWIMGQLRNPATGNMDLTELRKEIDHRLKTY